MDELNPNVILVDENDLEIAQMNKLEAHQKGLLHRAFSVFIFNSKKELLIHQRAQQKYHGATLWTNTCCSHPYPMEDNLDAANRRLAEEMGLATALTHKGHLLYRVAVENDLIEHEFDHIFLGFSDIDPKPNPAEVMNWKWITLPDLELEITNSPENFTYWFKMILPMIKDKI